MAEESFDWESFWDLVTPEDAAHVLAEWYGAGAADAAFSSAATALADDRDQDYRFWCAVFARLRGAVLSPAAGRAAPNRCRPRMGTARAETGRFLDRTTAGDAARVMVELYGAAAAAEAARLAERACAADDNDDHRFWIAVGRTIEPDREAVADPRPVFAAQPPDLKTADIGDDDYRALLNLPSVDELLRLIRQFARIPDRETRDFAIDRVKAIAEHRVVPFRGKGS